jgi:uncharacterized membrane protein
VLFPWNNVPKGGDDIFSKIGKWFLYIIVGFAALIGILYLWKFLGGLFNEQNGADKAVGSLLSWVGGALATVVPFILILVVLVVLLFIGSRLFTRSHYRKRAEKGVRYLRILPADDTRLDLDKISELTRTFGGMIRPIRMRLKYGRPWFRLRFAIPSDSKLEFIWLIRPTRKTA